MLYLRGILFVKNILELVPVLKIWELPYTHQNAVCPGSQGRWLPVLSGTERAAVSASCAFTQSLSFRFDTMYIHTSPPHFAHSYHRLALRGECDPYTLLPPNFFFHC